MKAPTIERAPESDRFGDCPHPRDTPHLFGHAGAEAQLLAAYRAGTVPQAWIIGGRRGIGKATLAWRFARFLLAFPDSTDPAVVHAQNLSVPDDHPAARRVRSLSHGNVVVLRREWNDKAKKHFTEIRVEDARRCGHLFHQAASEAGFRICVIDSADDLNRSAANALLKLVEEPPPRSLFLFIAHRPGRLMPTVRSRCRMLALHPLDPPDVLNVLRSFDSPRAGTPDALKKAADGAGGSVQAALSSLDADAGGWRGRLAAILARLPDVDWREAHLLADGLTQRDTAGTYDTFVSTVLDWLAGQVAARAGAGQGARALAPFAEVWDSFGKAVQETEALNLDRRPLIFSLFADLAAATRATHC